MALVVTLASVGCGNYSNEDLEFMSALPEREDVAVELPRRASLTAVGIADGWKTTLEVTTVFNGVADAFLSLIEKVRSYYPTARRANVRIWGPFPSDEHPGWRIEFRMTKVSALPNPRFTYVLVMLPPAGVVLSQGGPETTIISGNFDATGGVRVGMGHLEVTLDEARAAGVTLRDLDKLRTLTIDYNTRGWPRQVEMSVWNLPPADPNVDTERATYLYERAENGDGGMHFTFQKDVFPGAVGAPPLDETLTVDSLWVGAGPGRADISVTGGDTPVPASTLECWNDRFRQTYKLESWNPTAAEGEPSSCIPRL